VIQISREQLAEWNASARQILSRFVCAISEYVLTVAYRAWLESADIAFSSKQTQVRIILDNLGFELPSGPDVYKVVTKA
jgi:hypothetical protein